MPYSIIFSPDAGDEADAAAAYIKEHGSPELARSWYAGLVDELQSLAQFPHRCPLRRGEALLPGFEVREFSYGSHRVIYTVRGDVVYILHIRHVAQQDMDQE